MYEVSWHFVHSFTSYSRLSGATFAFVLYHHDNVPSHTSLKAMAKLDQLRFELVAHPPYSPDLVSSDYYLFPNLKRWLEGKRFTSNEEVIAETEAYFEGFGTFRTTEKTSKCWKIAMPSVSPSRVTMLRNKYNFAQKTLVFIKNPGTFQPISTICWDIRSR